KDFWQIVYLVRQSFFFCREYYLPPRTAGFDFDTQSDAPHAQLAQTARRNRCEGFRFLSMSKLDFFKLILLSAIWGGSFLFMRVAAPEFGPIALVWLRVAIAAL